ncbi:hypothetical protein KUTeg_005898 [Tegillarca granosa]|uniref:Fucolectin tachylectin-4 pentraxin-1 domain-containing protein n=1 Tax=Tegillarca granosa TaxID=220873 RepID=A0ABQ9FGX4_TEGGR|nr:hypothetical protein KUTeg_005898 [Tegillarca granosa]
MLGYSDELTRFVLPALFHNVQNQLENLASNKTAKQSSIFAGYGANRAVDDVIIQKIGYCSHTNWNPTPSWWEVDLSRIYGIESIKIYHRHDTSK